MAGSWCVNLEPAIIYFPPFKHTQTHFSYENRGWKPHFSPPQKAKIRGGKRQNKREKTRNFLIYFVKILVKRAKTGIERRGICTVLAVQSMVLYRSTAQNYPIDYHYLTNKHHPFPNNFQKPDPVIFGHGHFRSFSFSGAQISPISII